MKVFALMFTFGACGSVCVYVCMCVCVCVYVYVYVCVHCAECAIWFSSSAEPGQGRSSA